MVQVRDRGDGRNQEFCLSFAPTVRGLMEISATCIGTDWVDGNSPAAGALVDGDTAVEAERTGLNPLEHLDNNDSHTLFHRAEPYTPAPPAQTSTTSSYRLSTRLKYSVLDLMLWI